MIKVINISKMTVDVIGVKIKPKKIHIFEQVSMYERAKIASLCAVGKIRAYEIEDENIQQNNNVVTKGIVTTTKTNVISTVSNKVSNKVSNMVQKTELVETQDNKPTEEPKDEPTTTTKTKKK